MGTREEKKKPGEPRISIPSRNVEKTIRTLHPISSFDNFGGMKDALALVGASEQQTGEVMALLDRAKSEILSEEKNHLKAIQTDDTRIRLDTQGMEAPAKVIVQQLQNDIRATLPPDLAAILVSNTAWNQYYRTDENLYPTLTISRGTSGLWGSEDGKSWERRFRVDPKFPDDGTPIPADQVFDDRWKPFLKGLTLLPQNEK